MKYILLSIFSLVLLTACQEDKSGSSRETIATLQNQEQAAIIVGMPAIKNFTEKRLAKDIYELRDQPNIVTYTYTTDWNGKLHSVCPTTSIGMPIPYAAQYTAPKTSRVVYPVYPDGTQSSSLQHVYDADQPEPNGLYMPSSADGTWVVCLSPDGMKALPVYIEDKVRTLPFPVAAAFKFGE